MRKIVRLTENDLSRIVKRVIKEQSSSDDIVFARTDIVMKLRNKGYRLTKPGETGSESTAFKPKKNDLMIGGYDGKPLVFYNGYYIVSFEKDGSTIRVFSGGGIGDSGKATFFKLPKDLNKLENLL
jgi:hypothetical protein